LGKTTV